MRWPCANLALHGEVNARGRARIPSLPLLDGLQPGIFPQVGMFTRMQGASGRTGRSSDSGERARKRLTFAADALLDAPDAGLRADTRVARPAVSTSIHRREGQWKDGLRRRMLAFADLTAGALAIAVGGALHDVEGAIWCAVLLPVWVVTAKGHGLYDEDHARIAHLTSDELPRLFSWATASVAITGLSLELVSSDPPSHLAWVEGWATALGAAFLGRVVMRSLWRRLVPPEKGLVVGDADLAGRIMRKLALESGHHLAVALYTGPDLRSVDPETHDGAPVGSVANGNGRVHSGVDSSRLDIDHLQSMIEQGGFERLVVAVNDLDDRTLSSVVAICRCLRVKLSVAPPLGVTLGTAVRLNHLAELPVVEFKTWDPSRSTMALKRALDVVGGIALLALVAPAMAVIAVLIRLDSRGPGLFKQRRAGRHGAPFLMFKFRTMVADAETRIADVVDLDALAEPMFKLTVDPRVTRIGRFLRRTSLDELPQLFNVLRGDMSLVGPRPEEVRLVDRYGDDQRFKLEMRPGLTGPMQVHGRGDLAFQERLAVEREYIDNYSLAMDVKILLRTLPVAIRGLGAF
jgi:exopolysaccharide biosynthesis polyprenyl glycosylphosphotransferase